LGNEVKQREAAGLRVGRARGWEVWSWERKNQWGGEGLCGWPPCLPLNDDGRNFLDVMHQTMMISGGVFVLAVVFVFAVSFVLLARSVSG